MDFVSIDVIDLIHRIKLIGSNDQGGLICSGMTQSINVYSNKKTNALQDISMNPNSSNNNKKLL